MIDLTVLLDAVDVPADWVGLRYVREHTTIRMIRDAKPEANNRNMSCGVMLEVLVQGHFGYAATARLDAEGIQQAAQRAYEIALASARYAIHSFTEQVRPVATGQYQSDYQLAQKAISPGDLNHLLIKATQHLEVSDKVVSTIAMARIVDTDSWYVSSNGSDIRQQFLMVSADYTAVAQDGPIIQKRSDGGLMAKSCQRGMEVFDEASVLERCSTIGEQAVELLSADECPEEVTSLVLAPDQMMLQIHESVGHPLELDRILGDERNYAGWSFVQPEDFGQLQYGSSLMNITFDPTVKHQFASYAYDDAGLKAEKNTIIKDGVLLRGLGGAESQLRSGIAGVADSRASSWDRAPIDRMANLNLQPGESSFDEMIGSVERGVYMQSNRSWSIDDYRNKFQFGCEYAKLIEHGKLTKTLRNPNYRGISSSFWQSLKMVGNQDTFEIYGVPFCGKGEPNQLIRVGHASPVCLFEDVAVFGGA